HDNLSRDIAAKDVGNLGGEITRRVAPRRRKERGKPFADLRVVQQEKNRKYDRRESHEESRGDVDGDRTERRQQTADERGHLGRADLTEVQPVVGQFQRRETPFQRALEAGNPTLRRRGVSRNVGGQKLNLIDRQRNDDNDEDCQSQEQAQKADADRDRLGHAPFQASGNGLNAERDKRRDHENRDGLGNTRSEPQQPGDDRNGGDDPADPTPDIASYSRLHNNRRSVR